VIALASAAYLPRMRTAFPAIVVLAASIGLTGCGGSATTASRDCFEAWNAPSNKAGRAQIAGRFAVARVNRWRAEASGSGALTSSTGCGYVFHTSDRYASISGQWNGNALRWGVPPALRGAWSPRQQSAGVDNATVGSDGVLHKKRSP
jgi:hypothetical protein